jgi:hypothetical protein
MDSPHTYILIASLAGLLIGLLVAEYHYLKARSHANHVVPATLVNNSNKVVWQKLFYYGILCTLLAAEHFLHVNVPEPVYWLDAFAIAGGDVQKLANKFFRLSK